MHVFVEANGICDGGGEGFASLAMAMHMCVFLEGAGCRSGSVSKWGGLARL